MWGRNDPYFSIEVKMKVKLVSYSQPADEIEGLEDIQDLVAYCARVSNPSNQMNSETAKKLLGYLAMHKHWSPFEIAKEQARAVLPEGNTVSRMYMNGTLRSWMHYIELRAANGTQKEHIEIALECAKAIAKIFPLAIELV
jgi:thymidylate synthase ThyX